jgi:hypothetical protein
MADYIHPDKRYEDEIASSSRATNQKPKPSSSLALPGFRSVNPLVGIGAGGIIALVVISVLWSLIAHPVTSFAATTPSATLPPTNTTQETVDPQAVDPDPTSPPTSPAYLTHRTNAQQPVSLSTESTTSVAMQSAGPSGESPEEIAAADNARRVEEASYASSRMSFNSQNEQDGSSTLASSDTSQNYPIQTTATAPRNSSIAMTSENDATTSGQHGAFVAAHDGNPGLTGYDKSRHIAAQ